MKLTVIRGLPGSGKSTYARQNFSCLHVENDMMCMCNGSYEWNSEKVTQRKQTVVDIVALALSRGIDVVVSNTMVTMSEVNVFRELAQAHGAEFSVLRCVDSFGSTHDVPESTLKYMADCFENYPHETCVRQPRLNYNL